MNENIIKILKQEEESNVFKTKPYYCSERYPTYGWGFKCGNKNAPLPNITITLEEGNAKLNNLIGTLEKQFSTNAITKDLFGKLDPVRKATLLSMAYQLGFDGLLDFDNTLKSIAKQDWVGAGKGIRNSKAYRQTTNRWERNARMMETGILDPFYNITTKG